MHTGNSSTIKRTIGYGQLPAYVVLGITEDTIPVIEYLSNNNQTPIRVVEKDTEKDIDIPNAIVDHSILKKLDLKNFKYILNDSKEYQKFLTPKKQEQYQRLRDRVKDIRRRIKEAKKAGEYYRANELQSEMNGVVFTINTMEPTEVRRQLTKIILPEEKAKEFLNTSIIEVDAKGRINGSDSIYSLEFFKSSII